MAFERDKPYQDVYGISGVAFIQDGKNYRSDGAEVKSKGLSSAIPEEDDSYSHLPTVADEYAAYSDKRLEYLVCLYEGVWTTRAAALAFLKSHSESE